MPDIKNERVEKAVTNWVKVKYQKLVPDSIKFLEIAEYETGRELKVETEFKVVVGGYVKNDVMVPVVKPYHITFYVNKQWKVIHHEEPVTGEQEELDPEEDEEEE